MVYNPNIHNRKSIRLKGYDYSKKGLYFITICCKNRECLFGKIVGANPCGRPNNNKQTNPTQKMILNDAGEMIKNEWLALPKRFSNIQLHEYQVMPNHFHAILEIIGVNVGVAQNDNDINIKNGQPRDIEIGQPKGIALTDSPIKKTLGDMVGAFQSITTVKYIRGVKTKNWKSFNRKLWQRNYWEHIIRNEKSFHNISEYIINNPQNWDIDKFNKL